MRLGANRQRGAQSASLEDARGASYSLEMRGEEYPNSIPNMIRENKHKKEIVLGNESTFLGIQSTFLGNESTFLGSQS